MKKLAKDFSMQKYELQVRLVQELDAEFIISLRSDAKRTKYMLTLDPDVQQQRQWIKEYKKRERKGEDYYLLYSNLDGKPIGVNRISHIDGNASRCKISSWIKKPGPRSEAASMFLIRKEIIFDILKLKELYTDMSLDNDRVLNYYRKFNIVENKVKNNFLHITLTKENFGAGKERYKKCFFNESSFIN